MTAVQNDTRTGGLWRDARRSLLFSAIIVLATITIDCTRFGQEIEFLGYKIVQARLVPRDVPVTVIDIAGLAARPGVATPRKTLEEAIEAIADQQPSAIGVDIDFSPDEQGYLHPNDPSFFQFCLDTASRKGVPIFLGIGRTVLKPRAEWLGSGSYQKLAASIIIPIDVRRMMKDIRVEGEYALPARSMAAVLAESHGQSNRSAFAGSLEKLGLVENLSTRALGSGLTLREFWIDYGAIENIKVIRTTNPEVLRDESQREQMEHKIVLLGDASGNFGDRFQVQGRDYPGVLLHACAAYTLVSGPLYIITTSGRLAIDAVCILLVLATVTVIRYFYDRGGDRTVAGHRLKVIVTMILLLIPLAVGVGFVRGTRILWNEFLLGAAALLLHPSIEHRLNAIWSTVSRVLPRIAFEKGKKHP
jgi:CHASE2 domain-containing sensor protein